MDSAIKISKTDAGFSIRFPIELLDSFKATFKSAKWHRDYREWRVGPRTGKRLEQWAEAMESAAQAIDDAEAAELVAEELTALREQAATIAHEAIRSQDIAAKIRETRATIEREREALGAVKARRDEAASEAVEETRKLREVLSAAVDLSAVESAKRTMARVHNSVGRQATSDFREAQDVIRAERERLAEAGFWSRGLDYLVDANANRPDRDNVGRVDEAMMLDIAALDGD